VGETVGGYEIIRKLGEGGMGVVYLAEQREPIRRLVALKVVKRGSASQRMLARFQGERRALARLNHPNVAHVYDTGTADDGSPFIVMEHVPGETITDFCDARNATVGERIEVIIDVCRGVQHVHQKGLIHRDLKPPNILVADEDGRWTPKIIDFGIAKGMNERLTDESMTQGQLVGTPMYLAPESLNGEEQDTRVDVYALGLVLYRLLIGVKPVPPELAANFLGLLDGLSRGVAVPTLTRRFQQLTPQEQATVGKARRTAPLALAADFRRDLDWIVMKAIHADADQRYATPMDLAADLTRYLNGEPVLARPPSLSYVGAKVLRRYRWTVAAGVVLAASMLLGTISTAVQAVRARRLAGQYQVAAKAAEDRRIEAQQVSMLLGQMFESANPMVRVGAEPTVSDLLDAAVLSLDNRDLPPRVRAQLLFQIASAYQGLGRFADATAPLTDAAEILGNLPDTPDTLQQYQVLQKQAVNETQLGNTQQAHDLITRVMAIHDERQSPEFARAAAHGTLASVQLKLGDLEAATANAERALLASEADPEIGPRDLATSLRTMARIEMGNQNYDRALTLLERALTALEADPTDMHAISVMQAIAKVRFNMGDEDGAIQTMEEAAENAALALGDDHDLAIKLRLNVAVMQVRSGKIDDAEPVFRRIVESEEPMPIQVRTLSQLHLGSIEHQKGNEVVAEGLLRPLVEDKSGKQDAMHTFDATLTLSNVVKAQGRLSEAEALLDSLIGEMSSTLGPDHAKLANARMHRANLLMELGRQREAVDVFTTIAADRETRFGGADKRTHEAWLLTGQVHGQLEEYEKAVPYFRKLLDNWTEVTELEYREGTIAMMGAALEQLGRYDEAAELAGRYPLED